VPKTFKLWRRLVTSLLCAMLIIASQRAFAREIIEYDFMLVLVAIADLLVAATPLPDGHDVVVSQLETAVQGARTANLLGDDTLEASRLAKAIGAAEALIGMTSSCGECGDLRNTLQEIVGEAALLKTATVGASGTCHPNGSRQPNEQCDPLEIPTGCPVAVQLTFCSDECRCVPVP